MRSISCVSTASACLTAAFVSLFLFTISHRAAADSTTRRATLTDGVRMLLRQEAEGDTLAITLFVREEPTSTPAEEAVRQIVNSSLFYGSVHLSFDAASELAGKIGQINTKQTPDYVSVTCVTPSARYRDAIYLLCEAIKNAEFSADALERARTTILRLRVERESDPFLATYDPLSRAIRSRPEPDAVQLRHVTQEQAATYFKAHFVPARTVFSACGKMDPSAFQRSLDNNLFDYDRPGAPIVTSPRLATESGGKGEGAGAVGIAESHPYSKTVQAQGRVSYALVGVGGPLVTDPDYPAFCVLADLIGGGHASRMFRTIRDGAGIGYSVGTALRAEDGDPLVAYIEWDASRSDGAKAPTPAEVVQLIQAQLDRLTAVKPDITDAEIERARNFSAGQYLLRHERIQERAFLSGWYETMGAGYLMDASLPGLLTAVSKDDVIRVAHRYLPSRSIAVRVGTK